MSDSRGDDRHTKFLLSEDQIPRAWYNIVADLPIPPAAVLHPGTGQPIGPAGVVDPAQHVQPAGDLAVVERGDFNFSIGA